MRIYLLSVRELSEGKISPEECLAKLDSQRRKKAMQYSLLSARMLSIGAGLLLQLAWADRFSDGVQTRSRDACGSRERFETVEFFSVTQLLARLCSEEIPQELFYSYGIHGKPQFADNLGETVGFPCFNLSHSGEYICCAVADREIGIDIQKMSPLRNYRIAERYFSDREKAALAECSMLQEKAQLFYRIWVQKEAYAKLTGEGIGSGVMVDTMQTVSGENVVWMSVRAPEGYCMAVCCYTDHFRKERIGK